MSGKVYLVGAGPGDRGLLTLRGLEILERAEVVVYDALIGDGILGMIPPAAELIYVGKRSSHHAMVQSDINRVLVEQALMGRQVVRLKGGDPFLFGRGGEELELLTQNHIPYEIVPGVTSAFAVPAYSGIPVTHRDYVDSVHVITGHRRGGRDLDIDYEALIRTKGTLIFLMGVAALPEIAGGLLAAGMDPSTPAAVLERGCTAKQRRVSGTLETLAARAEEERIQAPAIILVGGVCSLAEDFSWREALPLHGVKVIVTRPRELVSGLSDRLRQQGAEVVELPTIRTSPVEDRADIDAAIHRLTQGGYDWVVFTSPTGVRIFMEMLTRRADLRALGSVRLAVIGEGSQKALRQWGLRADFMPSVYDGENLGRELRAACAPGARLLIPRAAIGNEALIRELGEGFDITDLPTYTTHYEKSPVIDAAGLIERGSVDFCVFTSASTVRGFVAAAQGADFTKVRAVCIGRQTAAEAEGHGMAVYVSERATLESLVECVIAASSDHREECAI